MTVAIRILHLIGSLRLGGAQMVVKQIAEHLDPGDVETFVYPLRPANIQIPIRGEVIIRNYPNYDPRKFLAIQSLCREHRIDLIHAHLHKPILGALLSTYRLPVPVIVHEHGPVSRPGLQYAAYRQMLKRLWPRAAAFIAVSQHIADVLSNQIGVAKEKIRLLPNALDFTPLDQYQADRQAVRSEWGIPDSAVVLGYTGRLNRVKGADLLPGILRDLSKQSNNYHLLVAGDGEEAAALRRQCQQWNLQDRVRLLGFLPDVRPAMAASDIALVPSRQEAFGLTALEWMRFRVPVITSGADGLSELITDHQTGWVVPENTSKAYARIVMDIQQDRLSAQPVTDRAFEQTKAYEITPYLQNLTALYRRVLNQS